MPPIPFRASGLSSLQAVALAALAGCATPGAPTAEIPPPLPRSSIAAVLQHRAELGLSDAQVQRLQDVDDAREQRVARLRAEAAEASAASARARSGGKKGPRFGASAGAGPAGVSVGDAGGGMGGPGGPGRGGGGPGGQPPSPAAAAAPQGPTLREQVDDADTAAWFRAEPALSDVQRQRARAIAEAYREELYEARDAIDRQKAH